MGCYKRPKVVKHGRNYPWSRWFSKGNFTLVRGVDFDYRCSIMDKMLRRAAKRCGLRVSIKTSDDDTSLKVSVWCETVEAMKRRMAECHETEDGRPAGSGRAPQRSKDSGL